MLNDFQQDARLTKELRPDRHHFSRIGTGFLIYNLLGLGFQMAVLMVLRLTGVYYFSQVWDLSWVLNIVCMYLLAFPITACYFRTIPKFGSLRNEKWEFSAWVVAFLIGTAMMYLGNLMGNVITQIFDAQSSNYQGLMEMIEEGNMVLTFLAVVIGAPVVEELLFRKFLVDRTIGYGEKFSVLLSGILFGIMHGNLNQFFYAFALGCLFAYIYCKTGKIRNTIIFHMLVNLGGGVIVPLLMRPVSDLLAAGQLDMASHLAEIMENPLQMVCLILLSGYSIGQMLAALVGFILFFVFKKYICFYPGIRRLSGQQLFFSVVANPGMAVFIVLCLLTFFG